MEARELRIGNLVYYRMKDDLDERKEWLEPNIIDCEDLGVIDENFQPNPLTEEWLLKFGFDELIENCRYFLDCGCFSLCWNGSRMCMIFEYEEIILTHIEHVHQLQNLYFALTGEELTLKN